MAQMFLSARQGISNLKGRLFKMRLVDLFFLRTVNRKIFSILETQRAVGMQSFTQLIRLNYLTFASLFGQITSIHSTITATLVFFMLHGFELMDREQGRVRTRNGLHIEILLQTSLEFLQL
jgi:hypothetical protein